MTSLGGFARVSRSIGADSLTIPQKLSFFRGEVLVGFLVIPSALWVLNRFVSRRWRALLTAAVSVTFLLVFTIQLRALDEVGRYISLNMMWMAFGWGLHEPGANVGYLSGKASLAVLATLLGVGLALVWSRKSSPRGYATSRGKQTLRIAVEAYILVVTVVLAVAWRAGVPTTPYHESTFVRAAVSLWKQDAVETAEFSTLEFDRINAPQTVALARMSGPELIETYRRLVHAPGPTPDPHYFGKERGDNVLFFILETTPDEFLPADDDMKQFPNLARLRAKSFVGARHYTTLPSTSPALFSVFSSWYPMGRLPGPWVFPAGQTSPDLFPRFNAEGFETAAFSPVRYLAESDGSMYGAVGFQHTFIPDSGVMSYESQSPWKAERVAADLATLHLMESNLDQWIGSGRKFAAAFFPQIAHFPYPDSYPPGSTENLRERGRAILAMEDAWLGELMDFLQKRGQLDKTVIVILGDHGRRSERENPSLRRGTIDETAFHVPLLIYAPRALDHTEKIPWVTSHIDVAPTVLDLLGVQGGRDSEQGTAIWNPGLAHRITFLFGQTMFGADGYFSEGKFYMWHYFSGSVYANSEAFFSESDFVPRETPVRYQVTSNIGTMIAIERAWHTRFARSVPSRAGGAAVALHVP